MAVRRISDLPNLIAYYPDYVLSNAMIEVSYAKPEQTKRYQSFYQTLNDTVTTIVNNIPRATKTQFGIVKIGDNINVISADSDPDKGLISVPVASSSRLGVVKAGSNVTIAADGSISTPSVTTATTTTKGIVKIGDNINVVTSGADAGKISVNTASKEVKGVVSIGAGIAVDNGKISIDSGQLVTTDVEVIDKLNASASTTPIGTIHVTKGATETNYTLYVPSTLNSSANVTAPMYDMGIPIYVPGSSYALTNTSHQEKTPTLRLEMVIDGFITYDGDIATTLKSGYVLNDGFNAAQYGYWANAGQVLFAKGNRVERGAASTKTMMVYPLRNGNTDQAVQVCANGSMKNAYDGMIAQTATVGYQIFPYDGWALVGMKIDTDSWETINPNTYYTQVGIGKMYVNPGWTVIMRGNTNLGQRTYTVTSTTPFYSPDHPMVLSQRTFGAKWDNHGPITITAINFGGHYQIYRINPYYGNWEKYDGANWSSASDPGWAPS